MYNILYIFNRFVPFPVTTCHIRSMHIMPILPTPQTGWIFFFFFLIHILLTHNNVMVGVFFISSTSIGVTWLQRITLLPVTLTNYNKRWIRKKKIASYARLTLIGTYLKLCTTWLVWKQGRADKNETLTSLRFFFLFFVSFYFFFYIICFGIIRPPDDFVFFFYRDYH